jgi:hypothetical protein
MSKQFSFPHFIESIIDKNYSEMVDSAEAEAHAAESISYGMKGSVKNREAGSPQYVQKLKKFLFFLKHNTIPTGADVLDVSLYKKVTDALIRNGYFEKSALDIFKK